jgi:subtilisin family serine protease
MNILTLVAFVMGTLSFAAPQAPVAAGVVEEAPPVPGAALPLPDNRQPPPHLKEVPAEIQDLFADGMPAEEFVARAGYVPRALEGIVDGEGLMIIELEEKPVAVRYAEQKEAGRVMTQATLDSHIQSLEAAQAGLEPQLAALGVERIISRYTVVYNGFQAFVPLSRLNEIRALPGVKAVHRAPLHEPSLGSSVDLIGAYDVWEDLGVDGEDITIAVIDTGIDYTHAAFGGPGTALAYDLNDPDFIEPNTFPTAKVIDGYDFVGTLYDPDCSAADEAAGICTVIPHPDPDPLDEVDHGTHVASIAAGIAVGDVMTGTAPGATLMALKVFGRTGGTYLTLNALEWATLRYLYTGKPEVINMSLGAPFGTGDLTDPSVRGTHNAAGVGIVVASAAGNAEDSSYITDSPGSADRAISVAASTTGYATGPTISIEDTAYVTQTNIIYSTSSFDAGGEFDEEVVAPLGYVGNLAGAADNELCTTDGIAANALAGQVALIQRGSCAFSVKVNNAAALGAVAAMIYNNTAGVVTMIGDPVLIPAGFIQMQDGLNLTPADGETAIVSAQDDVTTTLDPYTPPDSIATFSSRGPRGTDSFLKPEITAPGVGIFAANMGSGTGGVSKGGTSMATPHVAGVAALMMQANPGWTPEKIKAAMMNTAVDLADGTPIVRSGAGRVDAHRAVDTEIIAVGDEDLISLSYGVGFTGNDSWAPAKQVTVHNGGDEDVTYDVAAAFQSGSWTTGVSLDVDPDQVTVPAGGSAVVNVTLNVDMTQIPVLYGGGGLEEVYGFVTFTPPVYKLFLPLVAKNRGTTTAAVQGDVQPTRLFSPEDALRVPFYVQPRPYSQLDTEADTEILDPRTDMAVITMTHTGPITASTWIYPALVWNDAPDPTMEGPGDVRMFGLDYGWPDGTFGDMIAVAINAWDYWHVPQPYFAEFDLYIDADQDGVDDYVNFNFNYGWFGGGDSDNTWVMLQVDLATGALYLASPYLIYTDYNASFMEYYLPAVWQDLGPTNSTFDYQLFGFDESGVSVNPRGSFDYVNYPFAWAITNDPGPADDEALGLVGIASAGGTAYSQPEGVMLVDYNGDPRNVNGGQAYFVPIDVEIQSFTLLHTNDTHARLEPFQPWGEPVQGGVARRYTAIQEVKAEGRNVILLDAGDAFQGTLYFNVWQGEEEAYFMNALGYQAMAVGNHEFDSGPAALADFIDLADFPVLSANIDASAEPTLAGLIEAYTVLDVGGEQVGVFGLTTEETSILSSPGPNVVFNDTVTTAQATVAELEGMGINKIIALTHLGYGPDQALAAAVDGIDVIVGGHSHTLLGSMEGAAGPYPTVVDSPSGDPVLVVTAQDWGRYLGRLDVAFTADGELIGYSGEPIFIDESIAEDPAIAADVATFAEPI